jgi:hypothetical protein
MGFEHAGSAVSIFSSLAYPSLACTLVSSEGVKCAMVAHGAIDPLSSQFAGMDGAPLLQHAGSLMLPRLRIEIEPSTIPHIRIM